MYYSTAQFISVVRIQGLLFTFKFKNPFLLVLKAIVDDNTGLMLIERTNRTPGEKQL